MIYLEYFYVLSLLYLRKLVRLPSDVIEPEGGVPRRCPVRFPPGTPEYAVVVPRSSSMSDLVGPLWSRVWFFGASGGSCPDLGGEPSKGSLVRVLARPALVVRTAVESGSVVRVRTSLSVGAAKIALSDLLRRCRDACPAQSEGLLTVVLLCLLPYPRPA